MLYLQAGRKFPIPRAAQPYGPPCDIIDTRGLRPHIAITPDPSGFDKRQPRQVGAIYPAGLFSFKECPCKRNRMSFSGRSWSRSRGRRGRDPPHMRPSAGSRRTASPGAHRPDMRRGPHRPRGAGRDGGRGARERRGIRGGVPQGGSRAGEGETGRRIRQGARYALGINRIGF